MIFAPARFAGLPGDARMRDVRRLCAFAVALALLCRVGAIHAEDAAASADDPTRDPAIRSALNAMADASTWYHPDLFGEYAGTRRYAHHDYEGALKYFQIGAYFADKASQLYIGLMQLNGEGTPANPELAYAWLDIAAERGYPDFVATRDRVKATLKPAELVEAASLRDALAARYGDAVAKPRMAHQLRMGMHEMTGSLTGADSGVWSVGVANKPCRTKVVQSGCANNGIYSPTRWQPDLYFASRDREYTATVSVGPITEPASAPPPEK